MAITYPVHNPSIKQLKHARRNATAVLAGDFDVRPSRDVLTSLLNGVGPYMPMYRLDEDEAARRQRKKEKKARERERRKARLAAMIDEKTQGTGEDAVTVATPFTIAMPQPTAASTSSFWRARPAIHIATMQRSVSVTPPPFTSPLLLPSTPASTPGPSISSSTSRTSSKRPRTPDDGEDFALDMSSGPPRPRKQRSAAKKGWKGWVEGSPPPSEKLINLG